MILKKRSTFQTNKPPKQEVDIIKNERGKENTYVAIEYFRGLRGDQISLLCVREKEDDVDIDSYPNLEQKRMERKRKKKEKEGTW